MSDTHGKPTEGMECMCTLEDITEESYCEYQTMPSGKWHPAMYSAGIVRTPGATLSHLLRRCWAVDSATSTTRCHPQNGFIMKSIHSMNDLQPCLSQDRERGDSKSMSFPDQQIAPFPSISVHPPTGSRNAGLPV